MSPADPAAYRAAKESAALFDLTGWTVLTLAGRDCVKFLHNFCTNDIKGLAAGQGCEAFLTNVKARVVGHVFAFLDEDAGGAFLTVLSAPGQGEKLAAHLDRYLITEQVTIRDATAETGLLYISGPGAAERLREAGVDLPDDAPLRSRRGTVGDVDCAVHSLGLLGGPGFLLELPRADVPAAAAGVMAAGVVRGGLDVFDVLRIEAAFPLYGTDVTEDHLAPEVGRPWAINYTKGCYLGQEPIARIDALGHVNRLLCGLRLEDGPVPDGGTAVLADGKEIGAVTSATAGLGDGRPVALGYLRAKFAEPGTAVTVRTPDGEVPATVYRPTPP